MPCRLMQRRPVRRVAILGVGALGSVLAARLAAHAEVTLIGRWPAQLQALAAGPLRIVDPDGAETAVTVRATDDPARVDPVELVLVVTKAPKTRRAAAEAVRVLAPDGLALTLQNGMGHEAILAEALGADRVALGVTTEGATLIGPGVVRHAARGRTVLATRPVVAERLAAVADLFARAGLAVEVSEDVAGLVWRKLAVNAGLNPLTALLRVPNGAVVDNPWSREWLIAAACEVAAVAAAQGIVLPEGDPGALAESIARQTAANRSSMLQDVLRGAETEIDTICGAVVRAGEAHGVPTPVNAQLLALVKALEATAAARVAPDRSPE